MIIATFAIRVIARVLAIVLAAPAIVVVIVLVPHLSLSLVIKRMHSLRMLIMLLPLVLLVVLLMVALLVVLAMLAIVLLLILLMMLIVTFTVHRRLKGWFFKNNIFVGCVSYRAYTGRSRRFRGPAGPVRVPHQRQSRQPKLYPQSLCDVENFRELLHSI